MPAGCGIASWRLLGLSFAGWNVVASLLRPLARPPPRQRVAPALAADAPNGLN